MFIHYLSITLLACLTCLQASPQEKWVIVKGCSLRVNGNTNINKFSCAIERYTSPDTVELCDKSGKVSLSGTIRLPVSGFDCLSSTMNNDLRKTLKAKEFPLLSIRFLGGKVNIELAGVSRNFDMNYLISRDNPQALRMTGRQIIRFSDFNLTPPRKMGGMIRANDQLEVEFHLCFRKLSQS